MLLHGIESVVGFVRLIAICCARHVKRDRTIARLDRDTLNAERIDRPFDCGPYRSALIHLSRAMH